jgi:hypothetical protein
MSDSQDYKLDISGLKDQTPQSPQANPKKRPYLSVHFACCSVYQRVYRNAAGDAYEGRCPKCCRTVRFEVGPGGTSRRSFVAY